MSASDVPTNVKMLHQLMLVSIDKEIAKGTHEYRQFETMVGTYLQPGDIARCSEASQLVNKLLEYGFIDIGKYDVLKGILDGAQLVAFRKIVEKREREIVELLGRTGETKGQSLPQTIHGQDYTRVKSESEIYRSFCKQKTGGSFVETTQCKRAKEIIEKENTLIIIGHSGYGKSAFLYYISANPMEGYLPVSCKSPKEIKNYIDRVLDTDVKLLCVVDEPFGGSYIQEKLVNSWMKVNLEMYLGQHKFLFATRSSVWNDCKVHLASSPLFCKSVEFTPDTLTDEDKREMITKYLGNASKLTDREIDPIVNIKNPVAFCQCCKLMRDIIREGQPDENLFKLFEKPFSYLADELEKMKDKETHKYATLCLIALCGDIRCRELAGTLSDVKSDIQEKIKVVWEACGCKDPLHLAVAKIRDSAEKLSGIFLEQIYKTSPRIQVYTFSHDCMKEAVIMHYGKRHFCHCLRFLPPDLLVKISRPHNYPKDENDFLVCVPDDVEYNKELSEVFTKAAIVGNWSLYHVFQNPFVREENFQQFWAEYLKSCPGKLTAFIESKSWDGMCVPHLCFWSHAVNLLWFMKEEGVIMCTCRRDSCDPHVNQIHQAFLDACIDGSIDVLEKYLHEITKCRTGDTIIATGFRDACMKGQGEIVEYLLEGYYSPCKKDKCGCIDGLMRASVGGKTDIVRVLLSHGTDINISGIDGETGLHRAARCGHIETVQELLDHGAEINISDKYGVTCLHSASSAGQIETVQKLLNHGADTNSTTSDGETCLHYAAMNGHIGTLQTLLDHGADIHSTTNRGWTALHEAAIAGHIETVQKLLDHGANINTKTKTNTTALGLAKQKGHTKIVDMLAKCDPCNGKT